MIYCCPSVCHSIIHKIFYLLSHLIYSIFLLIIYILIRYWMALWFCLSICLSVILFVFYRNHFPVIQFQNQVHIRNPHETGQVFKTIWGAVGTSWEGCRKRPKFLYIFFYRRRRQRKLTPRVGRPRLPNYGAPVVPQFYFYIFPFTAAESGGFPNGHRRRPNWGANGAQRWRPRRHSPGGRRKSRRRLVFREFL